MKGFLSMPKREQYVFGKRWVGVSIPGRLGALSLWGIQGSLWTGCEHSRLGASVTLENLLGPGPAGLVWRRRRASSRAEPYCFPLRPVLVLVPIHSSCFLICILFCMDMPSSGKQGFLFFLGVSGQNLLFQIPCQVVRFRCVIAVSLES